MPLQFLLLLLLLLPVGKLHAAESPNAILLCLQQKVIDENNLERTVGSLRMECELALEQALDEDSGAGYRDEAVTVPQFFIPYKKNYIAAGSMKNKDGTPAFSGNSTDIKFELGMKFSLFPNAGTGNPLAPLRFGYSQKSWWDILEPSAPFREHNYNPEIFWEFDNSRFSSILSLQRSKWTDLLRIDRFGYEHQSNGLNEEGSRSWDRLYVEKEYRISEMFSFNLKLWHIASKGDFNRDISDYMGHGALTTKVDLNNWLDLELLTYKGTDTSKISYQLDLIVPITQWVNSRFFISYFDGYGEALINYNRRSKSLRAGFFFPLDILSLQ